MNVPGRNVATNDRRHADMRQKVKKQSVLWLPLLICWGVMVVSAAVSHGDANEEVLVLHPDAEGIQQATIVLDSYSFAPSHISVQAGAPIRLRLENQSFLTPHNFVIEHPTVELPDEVNVSAGESLTIQFLVDEPGTYAFYCDKQLLFFPSHREEGMEGRLDVRPARGR